MTAFRLFLLFLLLIVSGVRAAPPGKWAPAASPWDRKLGTHRVIVKVAAVAPAVHIHMDWRRPDHNPEKKGVLVVDLASGREIPNVLTKNIQSESGDVTFEPVSGAGEYAVYFLPVKIEGGAFPVSHYLPPQNKANPEWAKRAEGAPEAEVVRWEAISAHDAWNEMEVIATAEETEALAKKAEDGMMIFVTGPEQAVRIPDRLPAIWTGPSTDAAKVKSPPRAPVFQVAVWAVDRPLKNVRLEIAESDSGDPKFTCLSTEGVDWNGRPFSRTIDIPAGHIQPLWIAR
ncbi:MAG TPA: glycoside hydrolase domain-containing protein, partial [Verrucomicrobiales bacterium]|nr:glycoside hydrolase domain-containing protein [Verrucomicrobiales bacterium]